MKRVHVFEQEGEWGGQWVPKKFEEAVEWFAAKLADIPPEYRASARIEISGRSEYGDPIAAIEIYYDRPYTPEEGEALVREQDARMARLQRDELATLARLKEKYGA